MYIAKCVPIVFKQAIYIILLCIMIGYCCTTDFNTYIVCSEAVLASNAG